MEQRLKRLREERENMKSVILKNKDGRDVVPEEEQIEVDEAQDRINQIDREIAQLTNRD